RVQLTFSPCSTRNARNFRPRTLSPRPKRAFSPASSLSIKRWAEYQCHESGRAVESVVARTHNRGVHVMKYRIATVAVLIGLVGSSHAFAQTRESSSSGPGVVEAT